MIYMLSISLLILTVTVLILAIRVRFNVWIMLIIIPFLVFNIGFSYHTVNELWGYPVKGYPKEEVELLAYKIEQPNVFILVRQPEGKVRLYLVPYSKKTEEQLEGAGNAIKQGQRMIMHKQGHKDQESKVEFYRWQPASSMPKELQ